MTVIADILNWSLARPMWQRDALGRLVIGGEVTQDDIDELTKLCEAKHGLVHPGDPAPDPRPLTADDIPAGTSTGTVEMVGLRDVRNVDLLVEGQRLGFNPMGLTVIYGDNASGKSGYARILRCVCRARARGGDIKSNVFEDRPGEPASATVDFRVGGAERSERWEQGQAPPPELGNVSFFDAMCASVQVEATNEVAFTPFGLDLLGKLARLCQEVHKRLDAEAETLRRQIPASIREPQASEGTAVRRQLDALSADSELADFGRLATLTGEDRARIRDLRRALSGNPVALAKEIKVRHGRIAQLRQDVESLAKLVSDECVERIRMLLTDAVAKGQAAKLADKAAFGEQPVPGVGGPVWRELWESARKYSEQVAYPGSAFPVTEPLGADGARCVLCLRPLDEESANRLREFEEFIQRDTRRKAEEAKQSLRAACQPLRTPSLRTRRFSDSLNDVKLEDEQVRDAAWRFLISVRLRRRHVLRCYVTGKWADVQPLPSAPLAQLDRLATGLAAKEAEVLRAAKASDRSKLQAELNELEARQWLAGVLDDVAGEIERRGILRALDQAVRDTSTTAITTKSTALVEQHITSALVKRFAEEVGQLGAGHLQIRLGSAGGRYGEHRFQVVLVGARQDAKVAEVLSEGEFTCIALAGFLAELATAEGYSALVFDDPVCSLDHRWRRRMARRLAAEAATRQVVVFTHSIVFLMELREECAEAGVQRTEGYVRRGARRAGICMEGVPWVAMTVRQRIGYLRNELQAARAVLNRSGYDEYAPRGSSIYGLLRGAWEQATEEILLNSVVLRFGREVQTQRLRLLTDITEADVRQVEKAMKKCSRHMEGHDTPPAANEPVPEPDELAGDIEELTTWVAAMRSDRNRR